MSFCPQTTPKITIGLRKTPVIRWLENPASKRFRFKNGWEDFFVHIAETFVCRSGTLTKTNETNSM